MCPLTITGAARVVLFSVVSVCVLLCLSVNTITREPLEIGLSSRNFQGFIIRSKGRTSSKMDFGYRDINGYRGARAAI